MNKKQLVKMLEEAIEKTQADQEEAKYNGSKRPSVLIPSSNPSYYAIEDIWLARLDGIEIGLARVLDYIEREWDE